MGISLTTCPSHLSAAECCVRNIRVCCQKKSVDHVSSVTVSQRPRSFSQIIITSRACAQTDHDVFLGDVVYGLEMKAKLCSLQSSLEWNGELGELAEVSTDLSFDYYVACHGDVQSHSFTCLSSREIFFKQQEKTSISDNLASTCHPRRSQWTSVVRLHLDCSQRHSYRCRSSRLPGSFPSIKTSGLSVDRERTWTGCRRSYGGSSREFQGFCLIVPREREHVLSTDKANCPTSTGKFIKVLSTAVWLQGMLKVVAQHPVSCCCSCSSSLSGTSL